MVTRIKLNACLGWEISKIEGNEMRAVCFFQFGNTVRTNFQLLPGKVHPVPIEQEAGWGSEPVWTQRLEEKSFAGDRTPVALSSSL
jgi:hypothetical protein